MEYITTPAQAEQNAARRMREELGFPDARVTQATNDGGIDVQSSRAVAQVKWEASQSGRPVLQNLFGARGNALHKKLLFFNSGGYPRTAIAYADEIDMALFTFDPLGEIEPVNRVAERLIKEAREEKERKAREVREREEQARREREQKAREALALVERERQSRAQRALELAERERRSREAREAEELHEAASAHSTAADAQPPHPLFKPQPQPAASTSDAPRTFVRDFQPFVPTTPAADQADESHQHEVAGIVEYVQEPSPPRGVKHYLKWVFAWGITTALPLYAAVTTSGWVHAVWIVVAVVGVLVTVAVWSGDHESRTDPSIGIFGTALAVAVGYWAFNCNGVLAGFLWVITAIVVLLALIVVFGEDQRKTSK